MVATVHGVVAREQLRNELVETPLYKRLTASPPDTGAKPVGIERPILYVTLDFAGRGIVAAFAELSKEGARCSTK
ncbi:MAG: hypothetical protein QOE86_2485 [Solirubrobacteraceae bacterium]|nr:hypothetical protein [Solirubrobacteraceae bacterium]